MIQRTNPSHLRQQKPALSQPNLHKGQKNRSNKHVMIEHITGFNDKENKKCKLRSRQHPKN